MKKISFAPKPGSRGHTLSADQWVTGQAPTEPTKRLTIDVPLSLHRRIKTQCAIDDIVIADVVRDLLAKKFPEMERRVSEYDERLAGGNDAVEQHGPSQNPDRHSLAEPDAMELQR